MKLNKKIKDIIFQIGAILIVLAAALYMTNPNTARYIMIGGVVLYIFSIFATPYPGTSIRGKRLFNINVLGAILMGAAACFMFLGNNLWILILSIAAILTLYCAIMIPKTLNEEEK